jgi:hypothetical protein
MRFRAALHFSTRLILLDWTTSCLLKSLAQQLFRSSCESALYAVHVVFINICSGLSHSQTIDAVSQAWVDGQSLRTYRHAPNTSPRKSWAAGDACSRAVNLALLVQNGEKGLPSVLTAPKWGFYDVLFKVRISSITHTFFSSSYLFIGQQV